MENTVTYLKRLLFAIGRQDKLHAKTLRKGMQEMRSYEYWRLVEVIQTYFTSNGIKVKEIADDYLHMINDMRIEGIKFVKTGEYSCKSEAEAYEKVYSNPEVMKYYMNALLISQVLWKHHFNAIQYFKRTLYAFANLLGVYRVLDVGAGSGLFSWTARSLGSTHIDILDLSETSLAMTKDILGTESIDYLHGDISKINTESRYELIILGEILEHLEDPTAMLKKVSEHLSERGMIFFTVPTNAPAIDHVFLFKTRGCVFKMVSDAGLGWVSMNTRVVDPQTCLISAFCIRKP
jgi:2-polyprenyl-3-methyl-5-hydroxy-6-metoxy-1,4-benzoquinol methylase